MPPSLLKCESVLECPDVNHTIDNALATG
jgi:hypothetical protein